MAAVSLFSVIFFVLCVVEGLQSHSGFQPGFLVYRVGMKTRLDYGILSI